MKSKDTYTYLEDNFILRRPSKNVSILPKSWIESSVFPAHSQSFLRRSNLVDGP